MKFKFALYANEHHFLENRFSVKPEDDGNYYVIMHDFRGTYWYRQFSNRNDVINFICEHTVANRAHVDMLIARIEWQGDHEQFPKWVPPYTLFSEVQ